jgi:regulator of replication initiation timing
MSKGLTDSIMEELYKSCKTKIRKEVQEEIKGFKKKIAELNKENTALRKQNKELTRAAESKTKRKIELAAAKASVMLNSIKELQDRKIKDLTYDRWHEDWSKQDRAARELLKEFPPKKPASRRRKRTAY